MIESLNHILTSGSSIFAELIWVLLLCLFLVVASFRTHPKEIYLYLTLGAIIGYFVLLFFQENTNSLFFNMLIIDEKTIFFKQIILFSSFLFLLHIKAAKKKYRAEFYILFMFLIFGLCILCMVTHFILFYLALELVSLSAYSLVAFKKNRTSFESSIKYLIFGATSSAIMLYGISFIYGLNHSLYFNDLSSISAEYFTQYQVIFFLVLAGLLFKLSAAPFHLWITEVYESAPLSLLGFLSFAPKAAAIFVLYRLAEYISLDLTNLFGILILGSLFIGNLTALVQKNARLLIAFSGVAHAGFLMIVLFEPNFEALQFYVVVYLFMNMGIFLFLQILEDSAPNLKLKSLAGWGKQFPVLLGASFVIFISLIGLPPTAGFTAKLAIFTSVWQQYDITNNVFLIWILGLGLLNAAISIYYYLKIPYLGLVKPASQLFKSPNLFASGMLIFYAIILLILFFIPVLAI